MSAAAGLVLPLTLARAVPLKLLFPPLKCGWPSPPIASRTSRRRILSHPKRWENRSTCTSTAGTMVGMGSAPATRSASRHEQDELPETELAYFDDMFALQSQAKCLALLEENERLAVIVDRTILYPQGGGQPFDTGAISSLDGGVNFRVDEVRSKNGVVYHYGSFGSPKDTRFEIGQDVRLAVDASIRLRNSRLHSAGHLLDACMRVVSLTHLEPAKGHHFPDSPFVEYKGAVPAVDIENKRTQVEAEANRLVKVGGPIGAAIVTYDEAAVMCGGRLPDYIAKGSSPRIVTIAGLGCPCGGTHVADMSEIGDVKVPQIRVKKGVTKVSYKVVFD